jgi:transposase
MAALFPARRRHRQRRHEVHKPTGALHPRVEKAGPELFGIVSVDCAKARSKWMLADFFGNVLIEPVVVPHTRDGFRAAVTRLRQAVAEHHLDDLVVAVERTGRYHLPVKRAFADAGFEVRTVHPFATRQFRLPADPGNKTDDTDLSAIHRAAVNGFGLTERPLDDLSLRLRSLARYRRDLVRKCSALKNQILEHLELLMPGYAGCFEDVFISNVALLIARRTGSPEAVRGLGNAGLRRLLADAGVRSQSAVLDRVLAWASSAADGQEPAEVLRRVLAGLDDDRLMKTHEVENVERDLAALLARTPYVLLLSMPGINVVSAAEFAGEMGPIAHYANARAITGRAGLFPSRYQSDRVDRSDGPLVRGGNRALRQSILIIADNLMRCNDHFRGLASAWRAAGKDPRDTHVKVGSRFCRIAYQMVAGRQVYRHPSCQHRSFVLHKLTEFHRGHATAMGQVMADLDAAAGQIPRDEHRAEAEPLVAALSQARRARTGGVRMLGEILLEVLARLGVHRVESSPSGEADPT